MGRKGRMIDIIYPDGSLHRGYIVNIHRTSNGHYLVSYIDYNDDNNECFSEIYCEDGVWYKYPVHLEWSQYPVFDITDQEFQQIIREIGGEITSKYPVGEYNPNVIASNKKPIGPATIGQTQLPPDPDKVVFPEPKPKGKGVEFEYEKEKDKLESNNIKEVDVILYDHDNDGIINLNQDLLLQFSDRSIQNNIWSLAGFFGNKKEIKNNAIAYSRLSLTSEENSFIYDHILRKYGHVFSTDKVRNSSFDYNKFTYLINCHTCSDWPLYYNAIDSDSLLADGSGLNGYTDLLDAGLHKQIPLYLSKDGKYYSNGVKKDKQI